MKIVDSSNMTPEELLKFIEEAAKQQAKQEPQEPENTVSVEQLKKRIEALQYQLGEFQDGFYDSRVNLMNISTIILAAADTTTDSATEDLLKGAYALAKRAMNELLDWEKEINGFAADSLPDLILNGD